MNLNSYKQYVSMTPHFHQQCLIKLELYIMYRYVTYNNKVQKNSKCTMASYSNMSTLV